jgi:hypothetical protein
MGYETRIDIVLQHYSPMIPELCHGHEGVNSGTLLASVELSKTDGAVATVIEKSKPKKPKFILWPSKPERQNEAVELLRENLEAVAKALEKETDFVKDLCNDLEDGVILTDPYDDFVGVCEIEEFLNALKSEIACNPHHQRYKWAVALIESILESGVRADALRILTYGH